jgi:hypothetical protein
MFIGIDEQSRDLVPCERGIVLGDFLGGTAEFGFLHDLYERNTALFSGDGFDGITIPPVHESLSCQTAIHTLYSPASHSAVENHLALREIG